MIEREQQLTIEELREKYPIPPTEEGSKTALEHTTMAAFADNSFRILMGAGGESEEPKVNCDLELVELLHAKVYYEFTGDFEVKILVVHNDGTYLWMEANSMAEVENTSMVGIDILDQALPSLHTPITVTFVKPENSQENPSFTKVVYNHQEGKAPRPLQLITGVNWEIDTHIIYSNSTGQKPAASLLEEISDFLKQFEHNSGGGSGLLPELA